MFMVTKIMHVKSLHSGQVIDLAKKKNVLQLLKKKFEKKNPTIFQNICILEKKILMGKFYI